MTALLGFVFVAVQQPNSAPSADRAAVPPARQPSLGRGIEMVASRFTVDELALFEEQFQRVPAWHRWSRSMAADGREVLRIEFAAAGPAGELGEAATLTLGKTDDGRFAATGFDGWSLTVCDALPPLLEVLSRMALPGRAPREKGRATAAHLSNAA